MTERKALLAERGHDAAHTRGHQSTEAPVVGDFDYFGTLKIAMRLLPKLNV